MTITSTAPARTDWHLLDDAYRAYLAATSDPPWGSLIGQTIVTGPHRRALFASMDLVPGATVVDLGTGFGPIPLELAHLAAIRAIGIDRDRSLLSVAESTLDRLEGVGWLFPGAAVEFVEGEAETLPLPDESVDLVTARLIFQHLSTPLEVAIEAFRVLRTGGRLVAYDVDDGLSAIWPPESPETTLLEATYALMQASSGGDREIGRKLPHYFASAGFVIESATLLPQTSFEATSPHSAIRRVSGARHRAGREGMIATGLLDAARFDHCVAAFESEESVVRFRSETQISVVARKL
ncbi:MAG TPA: methyltransferase domain-containing protein [Acidimicrobiales bacterium]|nr:methyltransferase domain-containing protein [Acidimicrobiales bacterium]